MSKDNTIITITTCKQNIARQQALKETWVPQARETGYDVEFFDGARLNVPDDYIHITLKTKGILQYVFDRSYSHHLKLDDDTYVEVDRLNFSSVDYGGVYCHASDIGCMEHGIYTEPFPTGTFPHWYISGGAIWLSRKSIKILVETPLGIDWSDDRWIGHTLVEAGITRTILPDFCLYSRVPKEQREHLEYAIITQVPDPETIYKIHQRKTHYVSSPSPPLPVLPVSSFSARPALRFKSKP